MLSHCIGAYNLVPDKNIAYSKVFLRFPWVSIVPLPMKTARHGPSLQIQWTEWAGLIPVHRWIWSKQGTCRTEEASTLNHTQSLSLVHRWTCWATKERLSNIDILRNQTSETYLAEAIPWSQSAFPRVQLTHYTLNMLIPIILPNEGNPAPSFVALGDYVYTLPWFETLLTIEDIN